MSAAAASTKPQSGRVIPQESSSTGGAGGIVLGPFGHSRRIHS
jgi:hypothetical protein